MLHPRHKDDHATRARATARARGTPGPRSRRNPASRLGDPESAQLAADGKRVVGGAGVPSSARRAVRGDCEAETSDPDGDLASLAWRACAAGTRTITGCEVGRPGAHTATATVKNAFDATRSGSVNVQGMNRAPVLTASPSSDAG